MSTKHTPGPWKVNPSFVFKLNVTNEEGFTIAKAFQSDLAPSDKIEQLNEAQANARLIAAAPELLAALVAFLDSGPSGGQDFKGWHESYHDAIALARAAIAKAKGQS